MMMNLVQCLGHFFVLYIFGWCDIERLRKYNSGNVMAILLNMMPMMSYLEAEEFTFHVLDCG